MNSPHILNKYRSDIETELRSIVNSHQFPLYDMMKYHFGWIDEYGNEISVSSGKALRPTLCLLSCESVSMEYNKALPAAAAVELVHNFSLIHDDIQDDDAERRHRPTVWKVWGKAQAINAGTAMRILANKALLRIKENGMPINKYLMVQKSVDDATLRLIEGQYLDINYEGRFDIDIDDYLTMIKGKTAALIACSMEIGALMGVDDEYVINQYKEFGEYLGIAFQIRDDMLGIWGDRKETGKPIGSDIMRRKKSLPVVYTLTEADDNYRNKFIEIYQKDIIDEKDVEIVLDIMNEVNAKGYVQNIIDEYCNKLESIINTLNIKSNIRDDFQNIVNFFSKRNY